jgi:hypothetical protein
MTARTRMRRSRRGALLIVAVTALSACSGTSTAPKTGSGASVAASRPQTSTSGTRHVWKGVTSACPNLRSGQARQLGVGGTGTPNPGAQQIPWAIISDCHWGSTDGHAVSLEVEMLVWQRQAAADASWDLMRTGQTQPVQAGDEAFIADMADEFDGVVVRARSGNALATVRLALPPGTVTPARWAQLRAAAPAITRDVFDDLVPA